MVLWYNFFICGGVIMADKFDDKKKMVFDWFSGTADELKASKKTNDAYLKQINDIKAVAEDYIDKHSQDFKGFFKETLSLISSKFSSS